METSLLQPKKKLRIASDLVKGNYYYIYEVSDSLKSSEDAFTEINYSAELCYGKFDHFDRRHNVFTDVKCPNKEYYESRRFSIINNLFLEEEPNCCKILDGGRRKSRSKRKKTKNNGMRKSRNKRKKSNNDRIRKSRTKRS